MYCSKCGAQIPDGAAFCPSCGAHQNSAQRPQQTQGYRGGYENRAGQVPPYQGNQAVPQTSSGGVKINTYPMIAVILYGIEILLTLIMINSWQAAVACSVLNVILSIAFLVITILDLVYLSNIGIRGGWKWSVLIYPLYLYLRAKKTDRDYKWAIIMLIEWIVAIIISSVSSGALFGQVLAAAMYSGYGY